jgi:spore germination protein YaaH
MAENVQAGTQPITPVTEARSGGAGCWITGVVTLLVVAALAVAGLLLPPFNLAQRFFGPQYALLSAESNAVALGELTLIADAGDIGQEFGVLLNETPMAQAMAPAADAPAWLRTASAVLPPNAALMSSVYSIGTTGIAPDALNLSMSIPAGTSADLLDLYAWNADATRWEFIPAQATAGALYATVDDIPEHVALFQAVAAAQPRVLVAVDVTQVLSSEVAQLANIIAPGGLQPTLDGGLTGTLAPGFDPNAGYQVMPVVRNFVDARAVDTQTVSTILSNNTLRRTHAQQIGNIPASNGYDGIIIDYRELPADQRDNFTALLRETRAAMDPSFALGVIVPAAQNIDGTWNTGAYDWRAIGAVVDFMEINFGSDPSLFAASEGSVSIADAMLRWAVGEVSRQKLLVGVSALSARQDGGDFTPVGYDEALSALGDVNIETAVTEAGTVLPGTPIEASLDGFQGQVGNIADTPLIYIDYSDSNNAPVARMWLGTGDSVRYRMNQTSTLMLSGVGFDDLLANDIAPGVLDAILNYKLATPFAPAVGELALRWRIEGANGMIGESITALNEPLVATITAPDGNYAVNVDIVSNGAPQSARAGAAVVVIAATPTPTPPPTPTPTPTPAPTATRVPQAVVAAPSGGGAPAAAVAGPIVTGQFEYGGHVTNANTGAAGAMRSAGMNWMKVQIRYTPGSGAGGAAEQIAAARGQGFKILLGLVGSPQDLANGGAGFVQGFAQFAAQVAAAGPDAIEIWNEPNIDREWPRNQISGAAYADLLRQSYQAIKGANGGVMVISGAPAPTGAEAAFPGQVVNDDNWLRQFVDAGGLQWADCVGVHYNEGIVSPTQRSGDPRDNYYTRYLLGMLDVYWGIVGGQKPLCFTELGFLSPEGYGALPEFFAWAQNVTVAQQAAWLADSAALLSQSGRVRLMIIWNIDFTNFGGGDPMAGYAILRPGGVCPACSALAGAR